MTFTERKHIQDPLNLPLERDHKPEIHVECEKAAGKCLKSDLDMDRRPVPVVAEPSGFGTDC